MKSEGKRNAPFFKLHDDALRPPDAAMPEVIYRTKDDLHPRFGFAMPDKQRVYVREDLPGCVKRFVTAHELYHLKDKTQWWVLREVKANIHAAIRHPIGFVACSLMSLAPYRLRYYGERIHKTNC